VIAGLAARSHRVASVSTVHGFTGGGLRNRLNERVQLLALRRADAVIAVSAPLARRLAENGVRIDKIHLVPNAFMSLFDVLPRAAARERLGIRADALVAGWVGRLSKEKGADVMLEALAESDPRWQVSVIGQGEELEHLQQQSERLRITPRVTWHGPLTNAGALFSAFDAFVLSSRTEGTPITLLEAMNAGVPIVATRVGGVPDVVDSSHALLVDSEQPTLIARALAQIDCEPQAATERSRRARQRLTQSFGSAMWLAAVDSVYEAASRVPPPLR
jgi:glycosyltransferase involved in cell wall biosynthesis